MRVAVVGAGVMGSATAYALGRRGHSVTLFEQFELGHSRGSSHGRSRIVRRAYPDEFYTRIMVDAYPLWADLEEVCGQKLVHEVGLLYFGEENSPKLASMVAGLEACSVPFEVLKGAQLQAAQPAFRFENSECGVFTPGAGWVAADLALAAMRSLSGAEVRLGFVDPLALRKEFDAVVLAAGGWVRQWVPHLDAQASLQTFVYLDFGAEGPVWIEDGPLGIYGFPSEPGASTMKFGYHQPDTPVDLAGERLASSHHLEALRAFASRRLGVQEPKFREVATCVYTSTPSEDFRWGSLDEGVFWVSPCSGHGFKFAPWIGERMADFCEGLPVAGWLDERFGWT